MALELGQCPEKVVSPEKRKSEGTDIVVQKLKRMKLIQKLALPPDVTSITFDIKVGSKYIVALAKAEARVAVVQGWLSDIAVSKPPLKTVASNSVDPSAPSATIQVVVCRQFESRKKKALKRLE